MPQYGHYSPGAPPLPSLLPCKSNNLGKSHLPNADDDKMFVKRHADKEIPFTGLVNAFLTTSILEGAERNYLHPHTLSVS